MSYKSSEVYRGFKNFANPYSFSEAERICEKGLRGEKNIAYKSRCYRRTRELIFENRFF